MTVQLEEKDGIRLAIEGCGHGTLHAIYASVIEACKQKSWPGVDLLLIGGDFQAVRNAYDLNCVSMPAKYRSMCDFYEYYAGQRTAPYLTVFVGGNHEASNYLFELYYGGWVAPNIYYLGAANVLRLGPLRIAALSGIWKGYNYRKPHFERLPYNESDMKSVYHVRELDVRKLRQIRTQVDIGISHDWPKGVEWKGNWKQLFRFKPFLEDDAKNGQLGSVAAQQVMDWLRPIWWFSAHLHCKYAAVVEYRKGESRAQTSPANVEPERSVMNEGEIDLDDDVPLPEAVSNSFAARNADEIDLDMDDEDADLVPAKPDTSRMGDTVESEIRTNGAVAGRTSASHAINGNGAPNGSTEALNQARAALPDSFRRPSPPEPLERAAAITNKTTHFLALDKCLPARHFLQLCAVPVETDAELMRPLKLSYDREWLAITRAFALNEPLVLGNPSAHVPKAKSQSEYAKLVDEARFFVNEHIDDSGLEVPENFQVIAPVYDGGDWTLSQYSQVIEYPNPQTARFCNMLHISNAFDISEEERIRRLAEGPRYDPEAERFASRGKRDGSSRGRGNGRGRGRGFGRGRQRGR